jgi:hypothetical protein
MIRAMRHLREPVSESQLGVALAISAVAMAMMLWAILWQSNIIAYQRGVIRSLFAAHFGG